MKGTILTVLGTLSISGSALRLRMPRIAALADFCRMRGLHWVVRGPSRQAAIGRSSLWRIA
jgi:hypothetical protein